MPKQSLGYDSCDSQSQGLLAAFLPITTCTMIGAKSCDYCNRQSSNEAAFCHYCGKRLMPSLACEGCNFLNKWNANFCGQCGTALRKVASHSIGENDLLELPAIEQENPSNDSVVDVTNLSYRIPQTEVKVSLSKCSSGVPYWEHEYVYGVSELDYASKSQKAFYQYFKNAFLNEVLIDIEGNSNYAFILLFDLQNHYKTHRNPQRLEDAYAKLAKICPATRTYSREILRETMKSAGDSEGLTRLSEQQQEEEYWRFGSKFKKRLGLQFEDVELLNQLPYPRNNFVEIEYCCIEIIKLYLATIEKLKLEYLTNHTTLDKEAERIADLVARKHFRYRLNSYNYQWAVQSVTGNIYSIIFRHCENAVRERYGHKRKLNTNIYDSPQAKAEIDESVGSKIEGIIQAEVNTISPPDESTEIELNAHNTNRWKVKFNELTAEQPIRAQQFVTDLIELGRLNQRNPSVENIFFEGSKHISKIDKEAAVSLYLHYLHHDLRSIKVDNKTFTKTIQKTLFRTNEQLHEFERIVSDLISDRHLEKALLAVPQIYVKKRKEIRLDIGAVQEAHSRHANTVGLLNEYLQDEFEDDQNSIVSKEISNQEVQIEISLKSLTTQVAGTISDVALNPHQMELLLLFAKSSFYIQHDDAETFARLHGVFSNQLIESINEACYEILDDILIEEEDDNYIINPEYFKRIVKV